MSRSYLVAMSEGRDDRGTACCVIEDNDEGLREAATFRRRYRNREVRVVDYETMVKLMTAD